LASVLLCLIFGMSKTKANKCLLCGNETLQGAICVLCNLGIPQIRQELVDLLKEDGNIRVLKKLKIRERYLRTSLN
jgi:primosomal protein N'